MTAHARLVDWLNDGVVRGAFPSADAAVGTADGPLFSAHAPRHAGRRIYDMASLTKVMATTMVTLRLHDRGELSINDPISRFFVVPDDKRDLSIRDLLTHTAGFEAHFMIEQIADDPESVTEVILARRLSYLPRSRVVYSCIGFILLGRILERVTGLGLDRLADEVVFVPLGMGHTGYLTARRFGGDDRIMPTELDPVTGRHIHGVVHDENARFLRGVSGNAGVFSCIDDVGAFGSLLCRRCEGFLRPDTYDLMVSDLTAGLDAARGLGVSLWNGSDEWPGGDALGPGAFGHTGFTGTSLYVSPSLGRWFALLTNRVHLGRDLAVWPRYRAEFHSVCIGEGGS